MAYAILLTYFLLIFLSFGLVFRSLVAGIQLDKLFEGKAFFFLRSALGALLCTWYCESYTPNHVPSADSLPSHDPVYECPSTKKL